MSHSNEYVELIERCRATCLWFFAPDHVPSDRDAQLYSLACVERYGGRDDFIVARRLKQWLLQHSSETFAVS
jgi:hypothetical protein